MESGSAAPIHTPSAGSVVDGATAAAAAAAATTDEENAVAEMAEHLTIGAGNANAASVPVDLGAEGDVYSCKDCRTHLGLAADIVSKHFHSKNGKAYLFDKV